MRPALRHEGAFGTLPLACALVLSAACGGSAVETVAPAASGPSSARMIFPPAGAWTEAEALEIELVVEDLDGVASVAVAGPSGMALAGARGDGRWSARIPLAEGENALVAEIVDRGGERTAIALGALEQRAPLLVSMTSIARGAPGAGEILALDGRIAALVALEELGSAAPRRRVLSRAGDGLGPTLVAPAGLDPDAARGIAFVADAGAHALFTIDLTTGLRSFVSGQGVGSGPVLVSPTRVVHDASRDRLAAIDAFAPQAVLAVRIADGERSLLSGPSQSGPALVRVVDLALDPSHGPPGGRLIVLDRAARALVAIALEDGARTLLSGPGRGDGPALVDPARLALDAARGLAWVADAGLEELVEVELASGARRIVDFEGERPRSFEAGLVARADGRLVLAERDALSAIEPASGARTTLVADRRGAGPALESAEELVIDRTRGSAGGRALAIDNGGARLVAIDLASGDRVALAEAAGGSFFALGSAAGAIYAAPLPAGRAPQELVAIDPVSGALRPLGVVGGVWPELVLALAPATERVLLAYPHAVRAFALDTRQVSPLSDASTGAGPVPGILVALAFEPELEELFAIDASAARVLAVALASGDRRVVSDLFTGSGPTLADPRALALDGGRLIVLDRARPALVTVDPASGARTILSGAGSDLGAPFDGPRAFARDAVEGLLWTVHAAPLSALIATSPRTGERVLVAR